MVMGKQQFKTAFVCGLALVLTICFAGTTMAAGKPVVWRLQSVWTTNSAIHPITAKMCQNVKERSGGRLEIKLFGPGEIVGSVECLDAVKNGAIEMASSSGIYNSAKIPEGLIEFGLPFGLENADQFYEFWYNYKDGENFKMVQEAYREKGVELIHINGGLSYGYITKFPVASLADFKGKKIRSFGFFGLVVSFMGGQPVSLPNEDQFMALQQGTVDGTIFPYLSMETMKFKEVSKHLVLPPALGSPSSDIFCSKKAFDALDPDVQQILREEARILNKTYLATEGPQEAELIANPASHGITVDRIPQEEIKNLRLQCMKIWDSTGKKNDRTKAIVANLKAFLKIEEAK
ncbi:MAG: TRAP transporter substrate-binding protein DctP [Desulfobacteraceae bacterium]|nr:TRAP transporter substrate-binding protein DctP [Desulfobacteraceae bacterium]